jgi:predicted Zn finger-like uncharacterized protein
MHASSFPCPHCSAALRIRDRALIGRQVKCPDCGEPIEIVADGPRTLAARKAQGHPSGTIRQPSRSRDADVPHPGAVGPDWHRRLRSPVTIGCLVAVSVALTVLAVADPFGERSSDPASRRNSAKENIEPGKQPGPDDPEGVVVTNVQARFEALGQRLGRYTAEQGEFPPGAVGSKQLEISDRFSWLAQLAAHSESGGVQPWRDHAWHDPVNDRFVRRSLPEFQNPAIEQKVGQNRYPATHFAGMAGVGADAASLPAGHPRAGVFGYERRTRIEDIEDGASHTIAVAGVTSELGSWAATGRATVRPLAQEPYVNGPDGFGTGQADGMFVLMADGSVRFISSETSPIILRRMAAISDGLPLDPSVPGEPGDPVPAPGLASTDPQRPPGTDRPIDVPIAPEPPIAAPKPARVVDVAGALAQKIRRFDQSQAAPLEEVLFLLEEMAGVPIRYDPQMLRDGMRVSFKAEDTTIGGILEELLERAQLTYEIERDGIRLRPTEAMDE